MNKVVIGIFGSETLIGDVTRSFMNAGYKEDQMHIIGPPIEDSNVAERTRFITNTELDNARNDLNDLGVQYDAAEFYIESLRNGASILALESPEEESNNIVMMMQRSGAAHTTIVDNTGMVEELAHDAEDTGASVLESVETMWNDLKDAVQKVMS
jgi:hypothetical protein